MNEDCCKTFLKPGQYQMEITWSGDEGSNIFLLRGSGDSSKEGYIQKSPRTRYGLCGSYKEIREENPSVYKCTKQSAMYEGYFLTEWKVVTRMVLME